MQKNNFQNKHALTQHENTCGKTKPEIVIKYRPESLKREFFPLPGSSKKATEAKVTKIITEEIISKIFLYRVSPVAK